MWQIISTYIIGIITIIDVFIFDKIVLNKKAKVSKTKVIIIMLLAAIINTIIYLNFDGTLKTVLMVILDIIFSAYLFKITYKKSTLLTFLYVVLSIIPDLLELFFITKVLNLSIEYCYNTYAGSIIGNISICILTIITTYILRKILRNLLQTEIDDNKKIIISSIIILILSLMFFYTIIKEFRFGQNILLYLGAIIVLLVVLFSLIRQTIENNKLTDKYDKLLEYMTSYEKEIEEIRVLRHETKNEFLSIKSRIIDKQNKKEIIKYINEILDDKHEFKNEKYAKFGYLPANGIKGLCYFKSQEAEEKGLKTAINVSPRVENSIIYNLTTKQNRDLGKILGVLLDNAIEGGLESKAKEFGIEVYYSLDDECEFIICNTCDKRIDISKNGKERFSTKGKNRGHGLMLVNHLIKNNNIFSLNTNIIEGTYIQILKIKKSTK